MGTTRFDLERIATDILKKLPKDQYAQNLKQKYGVKKLADLSNQQLQEWIEANMTLPLFAEMLRTDCEPTI